MTAISSVAKAPGKVLGAVADLLEEAGKQLAFYAQIMGEILFNFRIKWKYRSVVFNLISDITIGAGALIIGGGMVFVIFSMSFFTGTEVGLQGYKGLEQIGAEAFTGLIGSFANTREVTPLIAGVAFAAQVGAGFTAELGAMRISDEIDALEVMSIPSKPYLVATRVTAAFIAIIPLYLISLFASFFATKVVTTQFFGLSSGVYDYYFRLYLPPVDVAFSLAKAVIFAMVVALIHCYYGFNASGGPAGVGVAVGRAIRLSIVSVVVLNFILSLIFWGGGNTVSLSG
ncbi:MAG: ABC transporter permease [Actinomycetota bacterium]|nr:ABC transporter permease [Acidimicrobiia bacterium]MDQ3294943.1 ABC transporter permease [Actinomycetota bacterium]